MSTVKKRLKTPQIHLEVCKAPAAAAEYAHKDESAVGDEERWGFGSVGGQGARRDIYKAVEDIQDGAEPVDLVKEEPTLLKYLPQMVKFSDMLCRAKASKGPGAVPQTHVLWGPTGTGKTHRVWEFALREYGSHDVVFQPLEGSSHLWWDDYNPAKHKIILMDEFRGSVAKPAFILRLCDRYPMPLPTKGSSIARGQVDHIFFTSNEHPAEWWPKVPNDRALDPFMRRVDDNGECVRITEKAE